jgi:hypothetical protein
MHISCYLQRTLIRSERLDNKLGKQAIYRYAVLYAHIQYAPGQGEKEEYLSINRPIYLAETNYIERSVLSRKYGWFLGDHQVIIGLNAKSQSHGHP